MRVLRRQPLSAAKAAAAVAFVPKLWPEGTDPSPSVLRLFQGVGPCGATRRAPIRSRAGRHPSSFEKWPPSTAAWQQQVADRGPTIFLIVGPSPAGAISSHLRIEIARFRTIPSRGLGPAQAPAVLSRRIAGAIRSGCRRRHGRPRQHPQGMRFGFRWDHGFQVGRLYDPVPEARVGPGGATGCHGAPSLAAT